jgi:hypothetical protein
MGGAYKETTVAKFTSTYAIVKSVP